MDVIWRSYLQLKHAAAAGGIVISVGINPPGKTTEIWTEGAKEEKQVMAQVTYPGVDVEEVPSGVRPRAAASTSLPASLTISASSPGCGATSWLW
jgi:hypothetical protein